MQSSSDEVASVLTISDNNEKAWGRGLLGRAKGHSDGPKEERKSAYLENKIKVMCLYTVSKTATSSAGLGKVWAWTLGAVRRPWGSLVCFGGGYFSHLEFSHQDLS